MSETTDQFEPGQRVVVTQQIPQRDEVWSIKVTGVVERYEQRKTGSWFAHAKDDKLWLDRLVVRKDDGELITFNLDRYTHIEVAEAQPAGVGGEPDVTTRSSQDPAEAMQGRAEPSGQGARG